MIRAAKQRGYVTLDELNSVLPSDETSPEQIEDIMSMLNEMGINVVESEEEGSIRRVSETVLNDIRILAMGVDTSDDPREGETNERAKTATFEVTPNQAEQVTLLTELGKLSLSLRSLATPAPEIAALAGTQTLTWDRDVSRVLRSGRISTRLLVLRGTKSEDVQVQEGRN